MAGREDYALAAGAVEAVAAPDLAYRPPKPKGRHRIALVGAGGISFAHLDAYRTHGFEVTVILSRDRAKAVARRDEFFPEAVVMTDYAALLRRGDIDVLDLTPHPGERVALIEAALRAGKHVLSQKPFVTDLDTGERLADLADANSVRLAVNQNGRWAPHMAWMRKAVQAGLIGEVTGIHASLHWDHRWIKGTPFERQDDIVLFDFGVHWFDFVTSLTGRLAERVQAQAVRVPSSGVAPPMGASVLMGFGTAQASLAFDAAVPAGPLDMTYVAGSVGSLMSIGPDLGHQTVTLTTAAGRAVPGLTGAWFNDGFAGAMGALLVAIETGAEPEHSGRRNLMTLSNTFAALEAARTGLAVVPGDARRRGQEGGRR